MKRLTILAVAVLSLAFVATASARTVTQQLAPTQCYITIPPTSEVAYTVSASGSVDCYSPDTGDLRNVDTQLMQLVTGGWQVVSDSGWGGWQQFDYGEEVNVGTCVTGRWYATQTYGAAYDGVAHRDSANNENGGGAVQCPS